MRLLAVRLVRSLGKPGRGKDAAPALEASQNIGCSATGSARALKVAGASFRLFFQKYGTRPQRVETQLAPPLPITSTFVVGAMLQWAQITQIPRITVTLLDCALRLRHD
jgi:hypothetical protein